MFGQSELKQKQADQEGKIRQLEQTEADKIKRIEETFRTVSES